LGMVSREQKITFGQMGETGVRRVIIVRADHRCSHPTTALADGWPDDLQDRQTAHPPYSYGELVTAMSANLGTPRAR